MFMIRSLPILVTVAVLAVSMAVGCIRENTTYTDAEQVINVGINEEFYIALDTEYDIISDIRYDWWVSYDTTMLSLVDSWWGRKTEKKTEPTGTRCFKFKTLKKGETEITMNYALTETTDLGRGPVLDKQIFTVNIK